jgi:hypothetical protein
MPSKPIHNSTLQTSFVWLCAFVFLMSSLVSANLYVRQQRAMHRTLSQDLGFSVLAAIEQVSAGKANEDG